MRWKETCSALFLFSHINTHEVIHMGQVWMIASGKGGVGKSTVAAALGTALARRGQKVCVVDADIGLRDQDAILGLQDRIVYDLLDVARKECALPQALVGPAELPNLTLLPAAQFHRVKELDRKAFRKILLLLQQSNDFVLIDCPAGIERGLRGLMSPLIDRTLIVCTPDDVCIRNAERVAALMQEKELPRPLLLVNRLDAELIQRSGTHCPPHVGGRASPAWLRHGAPRLLPPLIRPQAEGGQAY